MKDNEMREIELSKNSKYSEGRVALVSPDDYDLVIKYKPWVAVPRRNSWYAFCGSHIFMHHLVLHTRPNRLDRSRVVDHINGNGLDNRRENLRVVLNSQNIKNQKHQHSSSMYRGVSMNKQTGLWETYISLRGKKRHIGYFESERAAAFAFDLVAKELDNTIKPNFLEEAVNER